jgi:hypothetical protein
MGLPSQDNRLVEWGFAGRDIVLWRAKIKLYIALSNEVDTGSRQEVKTTQRSVPGAD